MSWCEFRVLGGDAGTQLRQEILDGYRAVISEWAGGTELTMPIFYGIRHYVGGARLMRHVDQMTCRGATPRADGWCAQTDVRVLSAIINVQQVRPEARIWSEIPVLGTLETPINLVRDSSSGALDLTTVGCVSLAAG